MISLNELITDVHISLGRKRRPLPSKSVGVVGGCGLELSLAKNIIIFLPLIKPEDALELLFFSQLQFLFKFT